MKVTKTVHPLPFDQLDGHQFERLVYAFFYRRWAWRTLEWYGETGDDQGQDIRGEREDEFGRLQTVLVCCANWRNLTASKIKSDVEKALKTNSPPSVIYAVGGGKIGARTRAAIAKFGKEKFLSIETWSGTELEERLRVHALPVIQRLFDGNELPSELPALRTLAEQKIDDLDGLSLLTRVFDRPAFYTPFREESSLPAFKKAIGDTIEALNTGILRVRDGTFVTRVPSRTDFASMETQDTLREVVDALARLRSAYDDGVRTGSIRPCGCADPNCSTFTLTPDVIEAMDEQRRQILGLASKVIPNLRPAP